MKDSILDLPAEQRDAILKEMGLTAEEFRAKYLDQPWPSEQRGENEANLASFSSRFTDAAFEIVEPAPEPSAKAPGQKLDFDRAFVGRDDDGTYVALAFINGQLSILTPTLADGQDAVSFHPADTTEPSQVTTDPRATEAVKNFSRAAEQGTLRVGLPL